MVFVVYTMEEDFQIPWCRLTLFTPQKQILNLMVYTMEAENGFHGVHHGRGFWHFIVYTMEGDFRILWCTPWKGKMVFVVYTMEAKNGFRGVHHGRGFSNSVV